MMAKTKLTLGNATKFFDLNVLIETNPIPGEIKVNFEKIKKYILQKQAMIACKSLIEIIGLNLSNPYCLTAQELYNLRILLKKFKISLLPIGNPEKFPLDNQVLLVNDFSIENDPDIISAKQLSKTPKFQSFSSSRLKIAAEKLNNFTIMVHVFNELGFVTNQHNLLATEQLAYLHKLLATYELPTEGKTFLLAALTYVSENPLELNIINDKFGALGELKNKSLKDEEIKHIATIASLGLITKKILEHPDFEQINNKLRYTLSGKNLKFDESYVPKNDLDGFISEDLDNELQTINQNENWNKLKNIKSNDRDYYVTPKYINIKRTMDKKGYKNACSLLQDLGKEIKEFSSKHTYKETIEKFRAKIKDTAIKANLLAPDELKFYGDEQAVFPSDRNLTIANLYGSDLPFFFVNSYLFSFAPIENNKIRLDQDVNTETVIDLRQSVKSLLSENLPNRKSLSIIYQNLTYRILVESYLVDSLENESYKAFVWLLNWHKIIAPRTHNINDENILRDMGDVLSVYALMHLNSIDKAHYDYIIKNGYCAFFGKLITKAMINKEIKFNQKFWSDAIYQNEIFPKLKFIAYDDPELYSKIIDFAYDFFNQKFANQVSINEEDLEILYKESLKTDKFYRGKLVDYDNIRNELNQFRNNQNFTLPTKESECTQAGIPCLLTNYLAHVFFAQFPYLPINFINDCEELSSDVDNVINIIPKIQSYLDDFTEYTKFLANISISTKSMIVPFLNYYFKRDPANTALKYLRNDLLSKRTVDYRAIKEVFHIGINGKVQTYSVINHLASLLNLYTIPNVNVEEVPTTPSSAMNTYVFIEEEIFIPRRLKDDIKIYRLALEVATNYRVIRYIKEAFINRIIANILEIRYLEEDIKNFAEENKLNLESQLYKANEEVKLPVPEYTIAKKYLKNIYQIFTFISTLKYVNIINEIKTNRPQKIQFGAKNSKLELSDDEVTSLQEYLKILTNYDDQKFVYGRISILENELNRKKPRDFINFEDFFFRDPYEAIYNKDSEKNKVELLKFAENINAQNKTKLKKDLDLSDINEKIAETKEVQALLTPIFKESEGTSLDDLGGKTQASSPTNTAIKNNSNQSSNRIGTTFDLALENTKSKITNNSTNGNETINSNSADTSEDLSVFTKLPENIQAIIKELLNLKEFTFEEFEVIAKKHNTLPNGAIDLINTWSYEEFDAPLLEIDTPMFFDKELLLDFVTFD